MKKKKNAFTLIELLAIIVILAIIAVITVPIILNIIENSKKGAATDSAYGYADGINKFFVGKLSDNVNYNMPNGTYTVNGTTGYLNLNDSNPQVILEIEVDGQKPVNGTVELEANKIKKACLTFGEYSVSIIDGKVGEAKKGDCNNNTSSSEQPSNSTIAACPGCKFIYTTENYAIDGSDADSDYSRYMPTEEDGLTDDYRTLQQEIGIWVTANNNEYNDETECYEANNNTDCEVKIIQVQRKYFFGLIESTTSPGKIGRAFACGIENGTLFCLEGYDFSKWSNDGNIGLLNRVFPSCNASVSSNIADCRGVNVEAYASNDGFVYIGDNADDCSVYDGGNLNCGG